MKHRIHIKGPFLSLSGYGHQARFALEAIRSRPDLFDIYLTNVGWGQTSWVVDEELRLWVEEKIKKTMMYVQNGGQFDVQLQITIPNEIEKVAPTNILYTAGIETTRVAPEWLQAINEIDKVIVVSNHSKQVFESTSYEVTNQAGQTVGELRSQTPIEAVNYHFEDILPENLDLELDYDFNFLTMAQWGPRKDLDNLIRNFFEEFWEDEVGLVIKTFLANNSLTDKRSTHARIENILAKYEEEFGEDNRKCKTYLVHGSMRQEELHGLYHNKHISAFITSTHGEGFGLSLFEAAYSGLPVIAPGWSGYTDFLFKDGEELFTNVKYTLKRVQPEAVWEGVIRKDSSWAFVDNDDFKLKMRQIYDNLDEAQQKANELKEYLLEEFTIDKKNAEFVDAVLDALPNSDLSDDEIDEWLNDMGQNLIEAN